MYDNDFYKYIRKEGNSYTVIKDGESFGSYSKLTDALYERDRLVKCNWEWEDSLELEETPNFYEKMNLPKFERGYSYVYKIANTYRILKDGEIICSFNTKKDAYGYAKSIGGEVVEDGIKYRVQKRIDGIQVNFGEFKTIEEAYERRDELMENGWEE